MKVQELEFRTLWLVVRGVLQLRQWNERKLDVPVSQITGNNTAVPTSDLDVGRMSDRVDILRGVSEFSLF